MPRPRRLLVHVQAHSQARADSKSGAGATAWPELLAERFNLLRSCLSLLYRDFMTLESTHQSCPIEDPRVSYTVSSSPTTRWWLVKKRGKRTEKQKNESKKENVSFFFFSRDPQEQRTNKCERTKRSHAGAHAARSESSA